MHQFETFIRAATEANLEDRQVFSQIVHDGLALTGMSLRDAATVFRTSPGSISRWENGHSAPSLLGREMIRDVFVTRVTRIVRELADREIAIAAHA